MKRFWLFCALALFLAVPAGCAGSTAPAEAPPEYPKKSIEMIAPAGFGSGYDLTMRAVTQCLSDSKLVPVPLPVSNIPGEGGVMALQYLDKNRGADDVLSIFSPPLCLIHINGSTDLNYLDTTTPIARLITSYGCFVVARNSRFSSLSEVMEALRENPSALRIGGISAPGSMDHIQFLVAAKAAGVEQLGEIEYVGFQDGTVISQLLGGRVDLISTGISDTIGMMESGEIRAVGITAETRVGEGIVAEIPTCKEQGIDAVFHNWRGVFGPAEMPAYAVEYWQKVLAALVETDQWKESCRKYGWDMAYLGQEEFDSFLAEVNEEYTAIMQDMGLVA